MRSNQTPFQSFQDKAELIYQEFFRAYNDDIAKARKGYKEKVHANFQKNIFDQYKNVQNDLAVYRHFLFQVKDEYENDNGKEFSGIFNQRFTLISDKDQGAVLEKLCLMQALDKLISFLQGETRKFVEERSKPNQLKTSVNWTGKIELEFVQLIYALNEAGYLNNEKNEITSLVKEVASAFNVKLGKNWQSNLSKSVNNRKSGYKPEIFEKLPIAFEDYTVRQINKNKKI